MAPRVSKTLHPAFSAQLSNVGRASHHSLSPLPGLRRGQSPEPWLLRPCKPERLSGVSPIMFPPQPLPSPDPFLPPKIPFGSQLQLPNAIGLCEAHGDGGGGPDAVAHTPSLWARSRRAETPEEAIGSALTFTPAEQCHLPSGSGRGSNAWSGNRKARGHGLTGARPPELKGRATASIWRNRTWSPHRASRHPLSPNSRGAQADGLDRHLLDSILNLTLTQPRVQGA